MFGTDTTTNRPTYAESAVSIRCYTAKNGSGFFHIDAVSISNRDADLADTAQSYFDQTPMTAVKRLIAADEQRRQLLRIEIRAQQR